MERKNHPCLLAVALAATTLLCSSHGIASEPSAETTPLRLTATHQLVMTANTRRPVALPVKSPRVFNQNPDAVTVTAASPQQLLLHAHKPGKSIVYIWENKVAVRALEITVRSEQQILQEMLSRHFDQFDLEVSSVGRDLAITGLVPNQAASDQVLLLARQRFPQVINKLSLPPTPVVVLHTQVIEVSDLSGDEEDIPWARASGASMDLRQVSHSEPGRGSVESMQLGVIHSPSVFQDQLDQLVQAGKARIVASPVLATVSGRSATYSSGGKFPVVVPHDGGPAVLRYEPFGMNLEITPTLTATGPVELRLQSELTDVPAGASMQYEESPLPAFRTRKADATLRLQPGELFIMKGLPQGRTRPETTGFPVLRDIPLFGPAFQATVDKTYQVEMLFVVRPVISSRTTPRVAATGSRRLSATYLPHRQP